ncbi:hypothetical protein SDC9_178891 [bioreactor metagenome]|uniref:Uncharacterized protein n=1 Tax=bioreactor metagenome TaxID=1076179 RepID=A0A645GXG6_9ZZZZ
MNGVHDQHVAARVGRLVHDLIQIGLAEDVDVVFHAEAIRAQLDLGRALLSGDIQNGALAGKRVRRLQEKRRFSDARITAKQHHHAANQPAAEDAVEFAHAGGDALLRQRNNFAELLRNGSPANGRALHLDLRKLGHGVPALALRALAHPFGGLIAAFAADIGDAIFICHISRRP